jgi:hypothetical protein
VQAVLQDKLPELLCIPELPLEAVLQFVRRGVKPSCPQLVDAARARVAGVEVWRHVSVVIGEHTGLPLAEDLVCSHLRGESAVSCKHLPCGSDGITQPS